MIERKHTVTASEAGRVDLVVAKMTGIARRNIRPLFDQSAVAVNGAPCEGPWVRVAAGDVVEVGYDSRQKVRPKKEWKDPAFEVVFEDEHLIVVNKSAAVLSVPAKEGQQNTLVHRISDYFTQGRPQRRRAYIVHRLDQGVSGLLVFGKTQEVADKLRDQFEARKPHRQYVAIVAGRMEKESGTFKSLLATDQRLNRYSTRDTVKGELAITHYKVGRVIETPAPATTLVQVELETGRRNQIRVHFAEAGHPVLGDPRYESQRARHKRWRVSRIALHAQTLGFTHPVTGEEVRFTSELPKPMARFIEGLLCGKTR